MKNFKKLSLFSVGATALTLGNIFPSYAQTLQAETMQNLNLRTGPSTNHSIILTIEKGSTIEVLDNSDIWATVKYKSTIGYVSSQYIKEIQPNNTPSHEEDTNENTTILMECSADNLTIRKGPSTCESILGKLSKTDRVYVVYQTNNGWSRIKYRSGYGYVSSQYLTKCNSNSDTTSDIEATMQCNTSSLNIRKGPSISEKIVAQLKYGDKVSVVSKLNNNWCKIKFNDGFAYVRSQYLSDIVSMPDATANFMKCNADALNVRSNPSTSEKLVGKLRKEDKVEIVYHLNSGWSRIKFNNQYAYVNTTYLSSL